VTLLRVWQEDSEGFNDFLKGKMGQMKTSALGPTEYEELLEQTLKQISHVSPSTLHRFSVLFKSKRNTKTA